MEICNTDLQLLKLCEINKVQHSFSRSVLGWVTTKTNGNELEIISRFLKRLWLRENMIFLDLSNSQWDDFRKTKYGLMFNNKSGTNTRRIGKVPRVQSLAESGFDPQILTGKREVCCQTGLTIPGLVWMVFGRLLAAVAASACSREITIEIVEGFAGSRGRPRNFTGT